MKTKEPRVITETLTDSVIYDIESESVEDVIFTLQEYKENYPRHSNLRLDVVYNGEYTEIHLMGERSETKEENEARLAEEKKGEAFRLKRKKARLEILQKEISRLEQEVDREDL